MNHRNLRDLLLFSFILLISAGVFVQIFVSGRSNVAESNSWVMHSYNVIIATQKLSSLPNRMLLEERSYLLTGDESFLNAYRAAREEALLQIENIEKSTADNADQSAQLAAIRALFVTYIDQLDTRLADLQGRSFSLPRFMEGYDALEKTRTDLTAAIRDFISHELNIMIRRTQETSDKRQQYFTSLIFGGTAAILLLLVFNTFLFYVQGKRQQAEKRLEDARQRFQMAMRGSNDSIFDMDIEKNQLFYSRQLFDLLGRAPITTGIPLEEFMQLVHPDDKEHVLKNIEAGCRNETPEYTDMYRLSHSDGRWIWVNSRGRCIVDANGKVERLVGATADVTYLRLYQEKVAAEKEEAERASAAKSAFLAHMSHEIRTPLTAINGVAEILQKNTGNLSDKQKQLVHVLHTSSITLRELVTDILDFSRIESGQVELDLREVNLGHILREVYEITALTAKEKGITYNLDYRSFNRVVGYYDGPRLRQVLLNLVGNAIKFTEIGSVTVTPKLIDLDGAPFLSVTVTDTGIGIADGVKEKIFEQFKQGDAFITKKFGGTGLGLTISQNLATLMGGHIHVDSVLGRGSIFTLLVPHRGITTTLEEADTAEPQARPRIVALHEKKVLLAEDYNGNIAVISFIFEEMGLAYDVAINGKQAVDKFEAGHYDAILMDVQMPVMDGFTATKAIREIEEARGLPRTPIICMTAHAMMHDKDRVIASGMDDYLTKPIFGDDLRDMLARHMNLRHSNLAS